VEHCFPRKRRRNYFIEVRALHHAGVAETFRSLASGAAEGKPGFSVEANQKQLLDRLLVGGSGFDIDAGAEHAEFEIEAGGLLHHVCAGEIVATIFQHGD
jgi:hypothetical protein